MNYLTIKNRFKRYLRKRKERKYIKVLVGRNKAEVTVETAIVFTIILVLICSMVYFSLYLHDIVTIKAYTYSGLVEGADKDQDECQKIIYSKLKKTPVFVTVPTASVSGDINKFVCKISEKENGGIKYLNKILPTIVGSQEVEVIRKMPIDKMYLFKAVKDGIKK